MKKRFFLLLFLVFLSFSTIASLDVSLGYEFYITSAPLSDSLDHYIDLELHFEKENDFNEVWSYGIEFLSDLYIDSSDQIYFAVPEAFVSYNVENILQDVHFLFVIGRYKLSSYGSSYSEDKSDFFVEENWSFMDSIWDLGLWQSRVNWDYFRPRQQGLTGFFTFMEKDPWLLTFFLSGVSLPDHGPNITIANGVIASSSRWFTPPQSEFFIFDQKVSTFYWMQKPYIKNVIFNDSIAGRIRFKAQENQWFSLAYGYKQVNQTYFKLGGNFDIDTQAITADIFYQSFKHSLLSVDFGITEGAWTGVFSLIQEIPFLPKIPDDWLMPVLPRGLFFSSYFHLDLRAFNNLLDNIYLNFIYSDFYFSKEIQEERDIDRLQLDLSPLRFRMHRGFAISAHSKEFKWRGHSISIALSYWYSLLEGGAWLNGSVKWQWSPKFFLVSEWDIVGTEKDFVKSMFSTYRQNDRIQLKLTYLVK